MNLSIEQTSPQGQEKERTQNATPEQQACDYADVLILSKNGRKELFDLELARQREAKRRLAVLGVLAHEDLDKQHLRTLALSHFLPVHVLISWKYAFHLNSLEGLQPSDWLPLKEKSQRIITKRLAELGSLTEKLNNGDKVTIQDICDLACQHNWKTRKAERLVRRYQIDGVWGLAPERDPERISRQRTQPMHSELAVASPKARAEADKRYNLIKPYIERRRIPNKELKVYAEENDSSLETLRKYLRDYKADGLRGLLPCEQRSDKGRRHNLSERMEGIIVGIRLSQSDLPMHEVHTRASQRAVLLAEPGPTLWQVRRVCDGIAKEVKEVADGRYGEYRNKHRITYRYHFDGSVIVYQIDFTRVDVLLKDVRRRGFHTQSVEVRAYLTTCIECSSRLVMGYLFTYDTPNSANIATVLHDALITSENKPYGGIPSAVWVDQGNQLISNHMQQIARDLHFDLHVGKPNFSEDRGDPQKRGRVERPFGTFNTRLWSTLPGYTHSNTKDRNPNIQGELTISELAAEFRGFIEKYHHEVHSETKETPLSFWANHCFATPAAPNEVDILLQELDHRTVSKGFIQYGARRYWHDDLWDVPADATVQIRSQPQYMRPDDILVYYNGRLICSAFALDSVAGRKVDGKRVLATQRRQRKAIQHTIDENKATLRAADQEIEEKQQQVEHIATSEQTAKQEESKKTSLRQVSTKSSSQSPTPPKKAATPYFPVSSKRGKTAWDSALAAKKRQEQNQRSTQ